MRDPARPGPVPGQERVDAGRTCGRGAWPLPPPRAFPYVPGMSDTELAERHRTQLAGYRTLLAALYPGKPLHTALLLADGRLVELNGV